MKEKMIDIVGRTKDESKHAKDKVVDTVKSNTEHAKDKVVDTVKSNTEHAKDKVENNETTKSKMDIPLESTFENQSSTSKISPTSMTKWQTNFPHSVQIPTVDNLKNLDSANLGVMSGLALHLDSRFGDIFERDPFTTSDPFDNSSNYSYYLLMEKIDPRHIVSMIVLKNTISISDEIWHQIASEDLAISNISFENAKSIKSFLMPKSNNNFYPFRKNGQVIGYISLAFQLCDLRNHEVYS